MKPIRLLCCLALAVLGADSAASAPATASTAQLHTVAGTGAFFALSVADLDGSARWYSEKLGLKVAMRTPKQDGAAAVVLEGDGLIVELIRQDDAVPLGQAAPAVRSNIQVRGPVKVGAIVGDFDATLAMLKARNVEIAFGPYPARENQRANVIIRDNEGNLIQFFGRPTSDGRPGGPA